VNARGSVEALQHAWLAPVVALYDRVPDTTTIDADVSMWLERNHMEPGPTRARLFSLLAGFPEFRNLYYYRLERAAPALPLAVKASRRIWRPIPTLDIACPEIGPGMTIAHGHGTIVTAARIGRNLWIHHQVTIGWSYGGGLPTLGDDVFVGVGAKILGDLEIGDGARIGANAVVIEDVPAGATAVGVPARLVRRR
jgi:serine O-acetyltransferase